MANRYLRQDIEQLLRDRRHRYADRMADPDDLNELLRLIIMDADRAHQLDQEALRAFSESRD